MATAKKFNLQGEVLGEVSLNEKLCEAEINSQLIKDYIVALNANARQWSASTKTRAEVKHTTKKPHKQKGTGRARQGSLVTAQFRGGGIVFGPKPKFDQNIKINKKERRSAIKALISEKIQSGSIYVLDSMSLEAPKTKTITSFLEKSEIQGKVLFVGEVSTQEIVTDDKKEVIAVNSKQFENFSKSLSNLKKSKFSLSKNINGRDVMYADALVCTESALEDFNEWLS